MKDKIIADLWLDKNFNSALNKICNDDKYKDDLKSEFFLILMDKSEADVIKMEKENYLMKWSVSVLKNQYHSNTSPFFKKYRSDYDENYNFDNLGETKTDNRILEEIDNILDNEIHWFDSHLFKLYYLQGIDLNGDIRKPLSTRKIENLHRYNNLKIDHTSVHKSVKKTLLVVKEKLRLKGYDI